MTQPMGKDMESRFPKGLPQLPKMALSVWAKSNMRDPTDPSHLQVWQHLEDTGAIAGYVWDLFLPRHVRDLIAADCGSVYDARVLFVFLASVHDVGKCSPAFQCMVPELADRTRMSGLQVPRDLKDDTKGRRLFRHEMVGGRALRDWLAGRGLPTGPGSFAHGMETVIAGHHGSVYSNEKAKSLDGWRATRYVGDGMWKTARKALIDHMAKITGFDAIIDVLGNRPLPRRTLVLLTSAVVVADWMASNSYLFPLSLTESDEFRFDPEKRAERAWPRLALPSPWMPAEPVADPGDLFRRRFSLPGATIRPVQTETVRAAESMTSPGLLIVEAAMGEGKTEAALMTAEILAYRFGCGGVFYGLPTMATANAMFDRVREWVESMPANGRPETSMYLSHSRNLFDDAFAALPSSGSTDEDAGPEEIDRMEATIADWLCGRRRGMLSDFVVGTIDQLLMAGLQSRYVALRHLAIAGKVVVLDEIHATTAYMNVYLETVLSWLGEYRVPVVMLSATLPPARRAALVAAYNAGLTGVRVDDAVPMFAGYPLLTVCDTAGVRSITPASSGRTRGIDMTLVDDTDETLVRIVRKALDSGGCVVVIRDTVTRARHAYRLLRDKLETPVTLCHSRFMAADRAENDRMLLERFGADSTPETRCGVVVATQVVEQSLDVDFDVMVSDIAPVDLLLQRAGRLQRHDRTRPVGIGGPRLYVTGVGSCDPDTAPTFAKNLERVYPRAHLMRTLAAMGLRPEYTRQVTIPDDLPGLVASVYGEQPICPPGWRNGKNGETVACEALARRIAHDSATAAQWRIIRPDDRKGDPYAFEEWASDLDPESANAHKTMTTVRGGIDSFEMILLESDRSGRLVLPDRPAFASIRDLPDGPEPQIDPHRLWAIMSCTVSVTPATVPGIGLTPLIKILEQDTPSQWHAIRKANPMLRGKLIGVADDQGRIRITADEIHITLDYTRKEGLYGHVD
ncbi:hypothetical protein CSQ85_12040 [Bifidobacterium rousetti]|nr:hypothetical protein CSQ85_12040 [Bifidobacterium rousetti]